MIVEHEGKIYETVISKPIKGGDLYYDCMVHEVRECQSFICFDPWSLKLELKEEKMSEDKKNN
jgi:hypothetical protein